MGLDTRWEDVDTLLDRTTRTKDETLAEAVREDRRAPIQVPDAGAPRLPRAQQRARRDDGRAGRR